MSQCTIRLGGLWKVALAIAVWLSMTAPLWAVSNIITPSIGYTATDRLTAIDPRGFDVFDDRVAIYADDNLEIYDRNTWQVLHDLGNVNYGTTYNSFVTFDPTGDSLWVGYTVSGNTNDRIYRVTDLDTTPTWTHIATLPSNYDLAFSGATPYVSGPNSTVFGADNAIWRLDVSGADQHTKIADVGGFAAGMAFDADNNLYYATNLGANDKLVRFSAQQVAEGGKTLANAETLTHTPFPGADVAVDAADHVLFAVNESDIYWNLLGSTLAMWDGTSGSGDHYSVIGTAGADHWYTVVRTIGDVTAVGAAYLDDGGAWGKPVLGLAEIRSVPEPSALVLLVAGGLAALAWRRRRT